MRILHTSDWHLGQELYGHDRAPEHEFFLEWLIEAIQAHQIDALLITGDIYDVVNPPVDAQQRFYRFLRCSLERRSHLQVIVVGGNHDSASRVELPRELLDPTRVKLVGSIPRQGGSAEIGSVIVPMRDAGGAIRAVCAAIPYLRPGDLGPQQDGTDPVSVLYSQAVEEARTAHPGVPIVVTGHLNVSGGTLSELSERRIIIGGEEAVSVDVFPTEVAYVALGHLHKPQPISANIPIRYAGSPFPLSSSERNYEHSITIVQVATRDIGINLVRIPRPVPFLRIPQQGAIPVSELESVLEALTIECSDERFRPFLEINVSMDGPVPDLRQRIDAALHDKPVRLTRILRETPTSQSGSSQATLNGNLSDLDPMQVFNRRYKSEHGSEPPEALRQRFLQIVESVQNNGAQSGAGAE